MHAIMAHGGQASAVGQTLARLEERFNQVDAKFVGALADLS
ncbi:hypothetical protein [Duganella violaceipulchra]|uniref:Uncharacterized protein n=1 Tax=Duganella violaceipulchra TaxID=2849652 RepID=A0ABT1GPN3_9BURK|nr:hypothetical protein [Duganella violaceicalia]MCP2010648.1 hypothetical protein [Duganella violaceicalia]